MKEVVYLGSVAAYDLSTTIQKMLGKLSSTLYQIELRFDLSERLENIRTAIMTGSIDAETIDQASSDSIIQHKSNAPHKIHFRLSCIFTELARIAQDNGDKDKAWSLISQASYHLGLAQGGLTSNFGADANAILQDRARKAAYSKSAKYDHDRKEVIRLLQQPPLGGWSSEKEAMQAIKGPLKAIILASLRSMTGVRLLLNPEKFETQVMGWIRHDKKRVERNEPQGEVRKTYEANSRSRLTNPNNY